MAELVEADRKQEEDACRVIPVTEEPLSIVPETPTVLSITAGPDKRPSSSPPTTAGPDKGPSSSPPTTTSPAVSLRPQANTIVLYPVYLTNGRPGSTQGVTWWYTNVRPGTQHQRLLPTNFRWLFPPAGYQFQRPANGPHRHITGPNQQRVFGYPLGIQGPLGMSGETGSSEESSD